MSRTGYDINMEFFQLIFFFFFFFLTHCLHKKKKFNLKTYNSTLLDIYGISVGEKLKNKL